MHPRHRPDFQFLPTVHALRRMNARRISRQAVETVMEYGRVIYRRGATYFVMGRKEIDRFSGLGHDIRRYEGIHVVCANGCIITVYRNHDLSELRKKGPRVRMRRGFWQRRRVRSTWRPR